MNRLLLHGGHCRHCRAANALERLRPVVEDINSVLDNDARILLPSTVEVSDEGCYQTVLIEDDTWHDLDLEDPDLLETIIGILRRRAVKLDGMATRLEVWRKGGAA